MVKLTIFLLQQVILIISTKINSFINTPHPTSISRLTSICITPQPYNHTPPLTLSLKLLSLPPPRLILSFTCPIFNNFKKIRITVGVSERHYCQCSNFLYFSGFVELEPVLFNLFLFSRSFFSILIVPPSFFLQIFVLLSVASSLLKARSSLLKPIWIF